MRHWQNLNLWYLDCEVHKVHMKCKKLLLTMPQVQNYQKHVWIKTMWAFFFYPCSSNFENLSQDLLLWWHCKCRLRATTTFLLHHSYELAASSVGTLSSTKFELSRTDSCGLKLFCLVKPTNWNWESRKLSDYFIWTLTRLRNKDTMCDGSDPVYRTHMRGTGQRRKLHVHCIALFYYYMYLKLFLVFI